MSAGDARGGDAPPFDGEAARAGVEATLARQPFMQLLAVTLVSVDAGEAVMALTVRPNLLQQTGVVHAGVTTALADNACAAAAFTLAPPDRTVVSVEFKINLLRPAQGVRLEAVGRVLKPGRTVSVCEGDVFAVQGDGARRHVARMQATMAFAPAGG